MLCIQFLHPRIVLGTLDGIFRALSHPFRPPRTLAFKLNLPRLEAGEGIPVASTPGGKPQSSPPHDAASSPLPVCPDAVACSFDSGGDRLAVMYGDRSLVLWDVSNPNKVARLRCLLSHSGGIWAAALTPPVPLSLGHFSTACTPAGGGTVIPSASAALHHQQQLVTCSSDGSIRIWGLAGGAGSEMNMTPAPVMNYAKDARTLKGMLMASPSTGAGKGPLMAALPVAPSRPLRSLLNVGAAGGAARGGGGGGEIVVRCMQLSADGRVLAAGDRNGNLRVFDVLEMRLMALREAHESEVLSVSFSPPLNDGGGGGFLATGGRDGVIHIFETAEWTLVNTLEQHSGLPVTAVRFSPCGERLISCGADGAVIFR